MKKQRKLIIGFMMLLALVVSGFTYAYWAGSITVTQAANKTDTIKIGTGGTVSTTVAVTGGTSNELDLVPVGREVENTSVSSITYEFDVEWNGASDLNDGKTDATDATALLTATATLTGADQTELNLFTVTNSHSTATSVTYGSTTTVTVTVTFTSEPADAAQYAKIAGKELMLTVSFNLGTVTPK